MAIPKAGNFPDIGTDLERPQRADGADGLGALEPRFFAGFGDMES